MMKILGISILLLTGGLLMASENGEVELVIQVDAEDLASLRATMDDLLACLSAVEVSLEAIQD